MQIIMMILSFIFVAWVCYVLVRIISFFYVHFVLLKQRLFLKWMAFRARYVRNKLKYLFPKSRELDKLWFHNQFTFFTNENQFNCLLDNGHHFDVKDPETNKTIRVFACDGCYRKCVMARPEPIDNLFDKEIVIFK